MLPNLEPNSLRVLIADDHKLLTDLLAKVLQSELDINIIVACTFEDAHNQIIENDGFDVVLLDLKMPGMVGLDSVLKLTKANKAGSTVIMSGTASSAMVMAAIRGGVRGFIPKSSALRTLPSVLRLIASGEIYLPHNFVMNSSLGAVVPGPEEMADLTERELSVLRLVAEGRTNKSIAWEIGQTEVVIKMLMRNICSKLGAQNRTQAAMIASEHGML